MWRDTKTAVNRFASKPKRQRYRKAVDRPGTEKKQNRRRNDGRHVSVDNRHPGVRESLVDGRAGDLPARSSSRMRSKISTFESTPIPMVRITPAIPGKVRVDPAIAHKAQQDDQVQNERQIRVDARSVVIDEHEDHDGQHADNRGEHALRESNRRRATVRRRSPAGNESRPAALRCAAASRGPSPAARPSPPEILPVSRI